MVTPPPEISTFVLYRKYRMKTAFPAGPDSVSLKDYRNRTHISRERVSQLIQVLREVRILYLSKTTGIKLTLQRERASQLVQVRREHVVNGNTVLFQSKSNFSKGSQTHQKNRLLRHYAAKL